MRIANPNPNLMAEGIRKYGWVNALRGYAIIMVIMIHTSQYFAPTSLTMTALAALGDLGVQLFFIASSFTLFNSFERREQRGEPQVIKHFFIRRFFRVAPYYYLAGFVYIAVAFFAKHEQVSLVKVLSNYTFTNGIYLPAINYIPPGGWSIGIEALFYLLVPILYKSIRSLRLATIYLFSSITISAAIGYLSRLLITNLNHDWSSLRQWTLYFWLPNQMPVFIFEILLYFSWRQLRISRNTSNLMLAVSIFAFAVFAGFRFPLFILQREYVYSAIFTLFALAISARKENSPWCANPIQNIGIVSFSMYLNHFMVLDIAQYGFKKITGLNPRIDSSDAMFAAAYFIILAITYLISLLRYKYIEVRGVNTGEQVIKKLEL